MQIKIIVLFFDIFLNELMFIMAVKKYNWAYRMEPENFSVLKNPTYLLCSIKDVNVFVSSCPMLRRLRTYFNEV